MLTFFCWKSLMMILLENLLDGTQSGTQFWNLRLKIRKFDFFHLIYFQIWNGLGKWMTHPKNIFNTFLESPNITLFDFILLGTTLGTTFQHMNIKQAKKSQNHVNPCMYFDAIFRRVGYHNGTQNYIIVKYEFSAF